MSGKIWPNPVVVWRKTKAIFKGPGGLEMKIREGTFGFKKSGAITHPKRKLETGVLFAADPIDTADSHTVFVKYFDGAVRVGVVIGG